MGVSYQRTQSDQPHLKLALGELKYHQYIFQKIKKYMKSKAILI